MDEGIKYVNLETHRVVIDPNTIQSPDDLSNYVVMNKEEYHEYCIEQRRKLDASKEAHRLAETEFNLQEDSRVEQLANQLSSGLNISLDDAKSMITRQVYKSEADFTVSEKVFGGVVLPEEEV